MGPVGQPDMAVVLTPVPGPPVFDEETAEQVRALTAKGPAGASRLTQVRWQAGS